MRSKCDELRGTIFNNKEDIYKKDQVIDKIKKDMKDLENSKQSSSKEIEDLKNTSGKLEMFKKKSKNLEDLYKSMVPQIQCPFGHPLHNPVTVIPCGHNYCLGCKKGYQKECSQCSGKLKIEAIYRNELMDDIIGIVGSMRQFVELTK